MTYSLALSVILAAAAVMLGLLLYAWRYRDSDLGRAFLCLMACALLWAAFFSLELSAPDLATKFFFAKIQFLGIAFLPAAWVALVWAYLDYHRPARDWFLLLLVPTLTTIVIWTNAWHHWFWGQPQIDHVSAPIPLVRPDYQFWFYYIHAPTGYLILGAALLILVRALPRLRPTYRYQGGLLLVAILLPAGTDVMYVLGYSPVRYLNFTTAMFSLSGIILAWGLLRYRFLDLRPLAHEAIIENMRDGVIVLDLKHRLVDFNPAARKIGGLGPALIGQSVLEVQNEFVRRIGALDSAGQTQADVEWGGLHFDLRITPVRGRNGALMARVATLHDITERTRLFRQVETLAMHDSLTGIFNRRHFMALGNRELDRCRRYPDYAVVILMVDLDHFKRINDTYGHTAGDQVLAACADCIQKQLRAIDLLGRLGGEEFGILLTGVSAADALAAAERIRLSIAGLAIPYEDATLSVTASLGVALSGQPNLANRSLEQLLSVADQALYRAKEAGRNRVLAL